MKHGEDPVPNLRQFVLGESEFADWGHLMVMTPRRRQLWSRDQTSA
jgi:hypothetical protein